MTGLTVRKPINNGNSDERRREHAPAQGPRPLLAKKQKPLACEGAFEGRK